MADLPTTSLEKESLEAHVDLCALRYQQLDERLQKVEHTVTEIRKDIQSGNSSMIKVIVGAAGTIVAGLLSTIVVLLISFN